MRHLIFTLLLFGFTPALTARLKPPKLPPAGKGTATKLNNPYRPPKPSAQSLVCVNWMADFYKFWLHVLRKGNDQQTLDLSTILPKLRVHFSAGQPTTMTFDGNGGELLVLPRHNILNLDYAVELRYET
jgi:hypothetical protein